MENILGLTVPAGSAYRLSQPIEMTAETWHTDTIVDILRRRASELPDKTAFVFLVDGDQQEERRLTYAELHRHACAVAAHLVDTHATGDRVLLFYPPGLDFLTALFGCLYAGVVAVPAYPPRNESNLPRIAAILSDARASTVLTTVKTLAMLRGLVDRHSLLGACRYIATDSLPATPSFDRFVAAPDRLALLQYTSGSTGSPKGVMVSHANVSYNSLYIQRSFSLHDRSVSASWLPSFHDMGLMDGVIQPIYTGFLGVILPPVSFVQKPVRWLAAIAKYRATHCGSPNFGYDLCVEKIAREQSRDLDLSCWESAYNGAEPVRRATLERFTRRFAENGVRPRTLYPCYGLAETTLMVSGGHIDEDPIYAVVDRRQLENGRVAFVDRPHSAQPEHGDEATLDLVSSGRAILETQVRIVDPDTHHECDTSCVGEVWVSGPSVCQGYWGRTEASADTFQARLANGEGQYLRTGDLGFLRHHELFITGRRKDLIIIRGRNLYPQDVEAVLDTAHPALRRGAAAAFALDVDGAERLVVVQEVERRAMKSPPVDEIAAAASRAVADAHEVELFALALIKTGSLPKTSSGKLQRQVARDRFLRGELSEVARWVRPAAGARPSATPDAPEPTGPGAGVLADWLIRRIAARVRRGSDDIDVHAPFSSFGLDSVAVVELSAELSAFVGRDLSPTLLYDFPTVDRLCRRLSAPPGDERSDAAFGLDTDAPRKPAPRDDPGAIAIVGMSCRLPGGVTDGDQFWRVLREGLDTIERAPASRWVGAAATVPPFGGFIADIDRFDCEFFGIAKREAACTDPQHRLLLEAAWNACEHAGFAPDDLAGTPTGVFIGISTHDYQDLEGPSRPTAYSGTGNAFSAAAGRISYVLGLEGPSLAVDTACSSSLVAVHLACQSLRRGESTIAIAAGVNAILTPRLTDTFAQAGMMAGDGRCKAFDARADGYVRSEGCVAVVLKPLPAAQASRDRILAVIRGTAANQDGRTNGLTAPNGPAQTKVVRAALADAGLAPGDISYVETHGTGTALGDPIEVQALGSVFGNRPAPLAIGSVKTNLGHLEAAAGLAGLIKVVLALDREEIPPTLHFTTPNPLVAWDSLQVTVPTQPMPWRRTDVPRRAGVSSFGFTGTNAHVVLEEAPPLPARPSSPRSVHVLPLSARSASALQQLASNYADHLDRHPDVPLADVCFSAAVGRSHFDYRLAVSGVTHAAIASALRSRLPEAGAQTRIAAGAPVAWLFTGQGSQQAGMARRLYECEPCFRDALDRCDAILSGARGVSLLEVTFADRTVTRLDDTEWTQPALFALEYALARLWMHWGLRPAAVLGHSVGEFVAATIAGVFSLEHGLALVAERGRLMQALPAGGGMLAVMGSEHSARQAISGFDDVAIAALNGDHEVVLAGPLPALTTIDALLSRGGIVTRLLNVSHAFHSPLMEPIVRAFARVLERVRLQPPQIPLISNVTGRLAGDDIATSGYWLRQLLEPVQFAAGLRTLAAMDIDCTLEIGPHPVLSRLAAADGSRPKARRLASLRHGADDTVQVAAALAGLYEAGARLDWLTVHEHQGARTVSVPTYPFQREPCWITPPPDRVAPTVSGLDADRHPLLGRRITDIASLPATHVWETDAASAIGAGDCRVAGTSVLRASSTIELAMTAAGCSLGVSSPALVQVVFPQLHRLTVERGLRLQISARRLGNGEAAIEIHGRTQSSDWIPVATARASVGKEEPRESSKATVRSVDLGVMFFNGTEAEHESERYRFLIETARFADRHGFSSVWVPERHYNPFGGLYPNPAVVHAALARETKHIRLMAGSIVLPLHHPLRAAEDWALVDNLSGGRIGLSVASGWNPDDFAMCPGEYGDRREQMFGHLAALRRLWRGERIEAQSGSGQSIQVRTYPSPVQPELPVWVTAAGNPSTFARAGEIGAHLLTHLLDQDVDDLGAKIDLYRDARARGGHDRDAGRVTVALHTFVGEDEDTVRALTRDPYCAYIKANLSLLQGLAFSRGRDFAPDRISSGDADEFVSFLYERFYSTRALLGTVDSCLPLISRLARAGVTEIACLVDFGVPADRVIEHLPQLARLRERMTASAAPAVVTIGPKRPIGEDTTAVRTRCTEHLSAGMFYGRLAARGVEFSAALQGAREFWRRDGEALVDLEPRPLDALTFEMAIQGFLAAIPSAAFAAASESVYLPERLARIESYHPGALVRCVHAVAETRDGDDGATFAGTIALLDSSDRLVARIDGFSVRRTRSTPAIADPGDAWMYHNRWEPRPLPARRAAIANGTWMLLADAGGVASDLGRRLTAAGRRVVMVPVNGCDPADPRAVASAIADAVASCGPLAGIVHLWSLDAPQNDALTPAAIADQEARGCGALLHIVQALSGTPAPPRLWVVTRQAQAVSPATMGSPGPAPALAQASVWGFGRVIAVEHPELWGGSIDLPSVGKDESAIWVERELTAEDGEDQVAYRSGERYVLRLMRAQAPPSEAVRLDPSATYLITGGTGGIGRRVASWMAARGATDLLLTGIRDRTGGELDDVEVDRRKVRVEFARVDAADLKGMSALVERVAAQGRTIRGVAHLAGVAEDQPISRARFDRQRRVLTPKTVGAWVVHEVTRQLPLDFFVAFSSISSVWGSRGQAFYAAANHFLDQLCACRTAMGLPAVAINWGPWADSGMVDRTGAERLLRMGLVAMDPRHALDVLGRLLAVPGTSKVVADVNWPVFRELFESRGPRTFLDRVRDDSVHDTSRDTELGRTIRRLDPSEGRARLTQFVQDRVAEILGLSPSPRPDPHRGFFDMGMDSLMALELKNRLQSALGLTLRVTAIFNHATINALVDFLLVQLAPSIVLPSRLSPAESEVPAADAFSDEGLLRLFDEQLKAADARTPFRRDHG